MLQVWNRNIQQVLKLPSNRQIIDHAFGLTTEMTIEGQSTRGVHVRHLEVMFKHVDDTFIASLEQDEQVFD